MLSRIVRQNGQKIASQSKRFASSKVKPEAFEGFYNTFMKNNVTYIGTILVACVAMEVVYGKTTTFIWETMNRGRLYHHIDWSQFKTEDDEEEEEDEDDE